LIAVREAAPEDAEAVAEISSLATAMLRETYRPKKRCCSQDTSPRKTRTRLVAVMDEGVVGTVQYASEVDRVHLIGLFVHPDFQRRGVARQIIAHLADIARRQGARYLSLYSVREAGTVPVFVRLGFRVIAEHEDESLESDTFAHLTDVYMERSLGALANAGDAPSPCGVSKYNSSPTRTRRTIG
jgi:GNAT superfamily N-acetyltransferase